MIELYVANGYPLLWPPACGIRAAHLLGSGPGYCIHTIQGWGQSKLECVQQVASWEPKTIHIQSSKNFQTPLHSACEGGYPLSAMWLLQVGVNPKVKVSCCF
ncbi:UNVERIFIED_CONTAM: hypothetical protein NCL1_33810 [Trichonephila clavipes]